MLNLLWTLPASAIGYAVYSVLTSAADTLASLPI